MTRKTLVGGGAAVLLGILTFVALQALQAQQSAPKKGTLTAEDRLEIQELLHRYMFVLDSCDNHNNGYEYADLYTPDGTFSNEFHGREQLARAAGRTSDGKCSPIRLRGSMNQIHLNMGEIIEPTPEGAKGISYLLMVDGPANELYWSGWYEDVLREDAERVALQIEEPPWRHQSRSAGRPYCGTSAVGTRANASR